jgi:carbohydrate kinase (thermoresistant glucokinase family)
MPATLSPLVVVMGVSGSGKTTVGRLLAQRLGAEFLEGDDLHPPRNVERMAAGIPLTDADRRDWLLEIAQQLADARAGNHGLVVSCSALKRSYRDVLRAASPALAFVHLNADRALLETRMDARTDHFMPASLLDSQLQTLEPPTPAERAASFDAALPAAQIAGQATAWLAKLPPAPKAKR